MIHGFLPRPLPEPLEALADLALDLRWTWSHAGDALWRTLSPETWERTRNPWIILQDVPQSRLKELAADTRFREELAQLAETRRQYLARPGWYAQAHADADLRGVAFFSMEFGLAEALPLYAGGLGVLAGDYLKAASDLGVPAVGVGLLWQVGYFRQILDSEGRQHETYPYNNPTTLPIQPVRSDSGGWLQVSLALPGRTLLLRAWQAQVGRVPLYLLDSNEPLNSPVDRGITGELYGGGPEMRLLQELVLGVGGWRLLEALRWPVDVCHLNEGHAAFVVLERARRFMEDHSGATFADALWATRAGNVFTTHTPVPAGFDAFAPGLFTKYFGADSQDLAPPGLPPEELLALGRRDPRDAAEPFNMAYLAVRGSIAVNGVSRLHGAVSRRLFQGLYPSWPPHEVPVGHVTNGVHAPSWDSRWADELWTRACGKERWLDTVGALPAAMDDVSDEDLWALRAEERHDLVRYARQRLARQLGQRGADAATVADAERVLDPNALTLGFARRFAPYKRPNLLLHDRERLARLLGSAERPVQIIVAGKAHPRDEEGRRLVQDWAAFVREPAVRRRAVFLEDYDLSLAQELLQGVDVWINTPRRPFEACGTSGMKALVNGGLNLSELDGWWAEAAAPDVGWALGDGHEHAEPEWDAREAEALYRLLEQDVVPAFYDRDGRGIPRAWLARVRPSMTRLAPLFSANRMLREYVEDVYLGAADAHRRRRAEGGRLARALRDWSTALERHWSEVRFGALGVRREGDLWQVEAQVYLGEVAPDSVRVELYAEPLDGKEPVRLPMERGAAIPGTLNGYVYQAHAPASRPAGHFTPRVIPYHPDARVPSEMALITWRS
jgi:starch phosphorylase